MIHLNMAANWSKKQDHLCFDIHPVQQAISDGCGQDLDLTSFMAENVVSSKKGLPQKQFSDAADCRKPQEVEGMES